MLRRFSSHTNERNALILIFPPIIITILNGWNFILGMMEKGNTCSSNRDKMQLAHSPGFCVAIFLSTPALFHNQQTFLYDIFFCFSYVVIARICIRFLGLHHIFISIENNSISKIYFGFLLCFLYWKFGTECFQTHRYTNTHTHEKNIFDFFSFFSWAESMCDSSCKRTGVSDRTVFYDLIQYRNSQCEQMSQQHTYIHICMHRTHTPLSLRCDDSSPSSNQLNGI